MLHKSITAVDRSLTNLVSGLSPNLYGYFVLMSYIGHPIATCFIGLVIFISGLTLHQTRLSMSGASIWVTLIISTAIKYIVARPRPVTEYVAAMPIHSYSFPSGHTTGSTIAFGLVAYLCMHLLPSPWKYVVLAICIILIISVGFSRVYLGAHYPTDVLGGWALGLIALAVVIFVVRPL